MNISLTPKLKSMVEQKVKSGLYKSSSEVIRQALRHWVAEDEYEKKMKELRKKLQNGYQEALKGDAHEVDIQELYENFKKKGAKG